MVIGANHDISLTVKYFDSADVISVQFRYINKKKNGDPFQMLVINN
jgi:hypothetical protein